MDTLAKDTHNNYNKMSNALKRQSGEVASAGFVQPGVETEYLDEEESSKCVRKTYEDGRTLTILEVDKVIIEKSMTYKWDWDMAEIKKEKEKGVDEVSCRYFAKGGLEIGLTYFGEYLIGRMATIDYALVTNPLVKSCSMQEELDNDIQFPMVKLDKGNTVVGYSSEEEENPMMSDIMYKSVLRALDRYELGPVTATVTSGYECGTATQCEFCGELPCVWETERDTVLSNDRVMHDAVLVNSKRRKVAYRHMYRVTNGIGQKGVRAQHPQCIEKGVRTLFPDGQFMGFKEE